MSVDTIRYVFELVRITKKIYPKQFVSHCFDNEIEALKDRFTETEIELLKQLITALTLLSQKDRICNQKEVLATRMDLKSAIYMVTPKGMRLKPESYELLFELHSLFGLKGFTYLEVERKLRFSNSKAKRKLIPLFYHGLLTIQHQVASYGRSHIFINPAAFEVDKTPVIKTENSFDIMNEDWQDFEGFNDCQMRT